MFSKWKKKSKFYSFNLIWKYYLFNEYWWKAQVVRRWRGGGWGGRGRGRRLADRNAGGARRARRCTCRFSRGWVCRWSTIQKHGGVSVGISSSCLRIFLFSFFFREKKKTKLIWWGNIYVVCSSVDIKKIQELLNDWLKMWCWNLVWLIICIDFSSISCVF